MAIRSWNLYKDEESGGQESKIRGMILSASQGYRDM